jgi:hypothetical protein
MASNGIGDLGRYDFMNKGMYPGSQIDRSYYSTPTQIPLGAQAAIADYDPAVNPLTGQPVSRFAKGGDVEEKDFDLSYSVRPQGSQEYDPRFMPFQLDNKPLTAPQMAIIRLQAEKELGEGKLRAAMMGNLMTIPGERGVRGTPGNYEVGYKVPAGIGNLDISAMRAMRGTPNGKIPYGVNASYNIPFNEGGIARFAYGGTPEEQRALIAEAYKKILGRAPSEGEDITQWASQIGETGDSIELANRLAQTEEGMAYGKSNPNDVYQGAAQLSQFNSPFKDTENPYSNMKYVASNTTPTTEDGQGGVTTHRFQDQNGGVINVDASGQPITYEPGRGWYDEQLRKNPDAVRESDYRNQTYLSTGPIDQTYKFNGVDVPIVSQEFQLDPETGKFITGKTGDYAPVLMKDRAYDWFDDWGGPAMVAAIPLAAYAGTAMAGAAATEGALAMGPTYAELGYAPLAEAATTTGASTLAEMGPTYAELGYTPGMENIAQMGPTYAELGYTPGAENIAQMGPTYGELGYTPQAGPTYGELGYTPQAGPTYSELGYTPQVAEKGMTAKQLMAANMGLKTLAGALGNASGQDGGGTRGPSVPAVQMPNQPTIQPTMLAQPNYGKLYDAQIYNYNTRRAAQGGMMYGNGGGISTLGSYSDGGRLLKGPGDGMSDNIPAQIGDNQPAALADGEFVVPADVVSHLGNGSTDAGAKQLYKMMDKIRQARTGNSKQGKQINPNKFLPKG